MHSPHDLSIVPFTLKLGPELTVKSSINVPAYLQTLSKPLQAIACLFSSRTLLFSSQTLHSAIHIEARPNIHYKITYKRASVLANPLCVFMCICVN